MRISLSKQSEVSLRQQLAEQIVFLISSGELQPGEQLPSVRALARRVDVHHNTVSEAYQDLVRRSWVTRQRGSRLVVGTRAGSGEPSPANLDELINDTILRAKQMGYSVQALTECVRRRLLAEPADHILVVEEEPRLRELTCHEVRENLRLPVKGCSPEALHSKPTLAASAQVLAPGHIAEEMRPRMPWTRPAIAIHFSGVDEALEMIRQLKKPSVIAAVSVSRSVLKTARGLFAPAIGRRHSFRAVLLPQATDKILELRGVDLAFCDSLAIPIAKCRLKTHYRLVASSCFIELAAALAAGQQR